MRAFITGGANGIGRAGAVELLDRGHEVAVFDVDEEALETLPDEIDTYEGDVGDEERVREVVEDETIDVLVNNAGYQSWGSIEDTPHEVVKRHYDTNVFGLLHATRAALPMLRERRGRVVNVTSMGARFSAQYWGIYSSTKHAARALTNQLRREVDEYDVDVVAVEPGPITTGFNERGLSGLKRYLPDSAYADHYWEYLEVDDFGGKPPKAAGQVVAKAATTKRPSAHYPVHYYARVLPKLKVLLPTSLWDWVVKQF